MNYGHQEIDNVDDLTRLLKNKLDKGNFIISVDGYVGVGKTYISEKITEGMRAHLVSGDVDEFLVFD